MFFVRFQFVPLKVTRIRLSYKALFEVLHEVIEDCISRCRSAQRSDKGYSRIYVASGARWFRLGYGTVASC